MKVPFYIVLLSFWPILVCGQTRVVMDSLIDQLSFPMHDTVRIQILNQIATEAIYHDPDMIINYADAALELSMQNDFKKGIAEANNNIGSYLRLKGRYEEAMDYFFKGLEIMEDIRFKEGIARSYNMFGILYFVLENYDQSIENYEKSLRLYTEIQDKKWIAGISNNIGMIHERNGNYEKALEYYGKSLEISQEISNQNWISINFTNIGSLYLGLNHPMSLFFFKRSLDIRNAMDDTLGMAFAGYMIGKYYVHNKQFANGIPFLKKGHEIAKRSGNVQLNMLISEQLSTAYAEIHDYKNAYNLHVIFKLYSDSLDLQSSMQKLTRLQFMQEYRKKKQQEDIVHSKVQTRQGIFALALAGVILTLLFLYLFQKSKIKLHRIEQARIKIENDALAEELKFKEKLLEENINYLLNKNSLLTIVMEDLSSLKPQLKPENHTLINQLIMELQGSLQDESGEEFEVRFNQIQQDFYANLIARYPDLTANETKLCAFLRLKMSSKEISLLTGQSIKSIDTARSRLRKKLNLAHSEKSLVDLLENL